MYPVKSPCAAVFVADVVQVLPSSFELEVVRQSTSKEFHYGGDLKAQVDTEDIEVDLTESDNWETTHRTVTVSEAHVVPCPVFLPNSLKSLQPMRDDINI